MLFDTLLEFHIVSKKDNKIYSTSRDIKAIKQAFDTLGDASKNYFIINSHSIDCTAFCLSKG